ncbi:uncharacterized protein LOC34619095 [Cyclospora cayetanensis]|uniref:Uncharacterized protein LOC34619095 n=1 Tax=Cyclospora cayetanensis TaxID=88456 RepID=A0A6P6S4F1_9EIME|nr:uncharacterized protein LOC34619095 [Cyclospora cayetanensis]
MRVVGDIVFPGAATRAGDLLRRHASCKSWRRNKAEVIEQWMREKGLPFVRLDKTAAAAWGFLDFESPEQLAQFERATEKLPFRGSIIYLHAANAREERQQETVQQEASHQEGLPRQPQKKAMPPLKEGHVRKRSRVHSAAAAGGCDDEGTAAAKAGTTECDFGLEQHRQLPALLQLIDNKPHLTDAASIEQRVAPLHGYSYYDQLQMKHTYLKVLPALPAPVEGRVGYRNKCEFTIGLTRKQQGQPLELQADEEEQTTPCVGFVCGVQRMQPQVAPPSGTWRLLMVRTSAWSRSMMLAVQIRPFESESQESAHARSELIQSVVAAFGGRTFGDYKVTSIYLQENSALSDSVEGHPMEKIYGSDVLEQRLFDLHFRLGPSSFFQVGCGARRQFAPTAAAICCLHRCLKSSDKGNRAAATARLFDRGAPCAFAAATAAAPAKVLLSDICAQTNTPACETMYKAVLEMLLPLPPSGPLLDVCSGAGTIALCAAAAIKQAANSSSSSRRVIGIEMVEAAVMDARRNARLNGLEKDVHFIAGKAEDVLPGLLEEFSAETYISAVVDPPRMGLHPQVLKALKQCKQLEKLVYVSCNCKTLAENVLELSSEESDDPFVPIAALPVDMFPHTLHCEAVLLLARRSRAAATAAEYHSTKRDKLLKLTAVEPALATGEPFTPSDDEEDEETTHQGMEAAAGCTRENGDGSGPSTNKHAHPQHLPPAASSTTPIWQGANPLLD